MNYLIIEEMPVYRGYRIYAEMFSEKSWCYDSVKYYDYPLKIAEKLYRQQFGLVGKHLVKEQIKF